VPEVGAAVCQAIERGRRTLIIPKRMGFLHFVREVPNHLNDLLLMGNESKVS
jgi:hypothetical protein